MLKIYLQSIINHTSKGKIVSSFIVLIFVCFFNDAIAQDNLKKEVQVVKPYEPAISDAFKLNSLPQIIDTVNILSSFNYPMKSFPVSIDYEITPIKAAKMIGEPLKKLYSSYIKLGFGNYITPLVELHYGSKYSKKYIYQADFKHISSSGKIKNSNDRKVFSGFSQNELNVSGKKFLKDKSFSGGLQYNNNTNYYYGYNPLLNYAEIPTSFKSSMDKQNINSIVGKLRIESNFLDSAQVNYNIALLYGYMQDVYKSTEQNIDLNIDIDYYFENEFVGIESRIINYNTNISGSINGLSNDINTVVQFNPWLGAFGKKWQIVAGLNTFYELNNAKYTIFPKVRLHYNIIDYFLIPYIEINSNVALNSYREFLFENPYYLYTNSQSTESKVLSGGFRGNFSSNMSFNFRLNYSDIKNQYFYVNDTNFISENRFKVVYDNVKIVNLLGEISYKKTERLNFLFKAEYNYYDLNTIDHAWHKPEYEASFSARYNMKDKILLNTDIFIVGKRYALEYHPIERSIELDGVIDINIGVEYKYSRKLSAFLKLNNIAAQNYYQWNYYPGHQFNAMIGVTYSL